MSVLDALKKKSLIQKNKKLFKNIDPQIKDFVFFSDNTPPKMPDKYEGVIEPSTIFLDQPLIRPNEYTGVSKTDYYPCYYELTTEQKYKYYEFLCEPFTGLHDIGYVFLFYYGLERHLQYGDYLKAAEIIIRLRDIYGHQTFQAITRHSLVVSALYRNHLDFLEHFLNVCEIKNEFLFDTNLLIYLKCIRNQTLTPSDLVSNRKYFGDTNRYPPTKDGIAFEETVADCMETLIGNDSVSLSFLIEDTETIPKESRPVYENLSLRKCEISLFDYLSYPPLYDQCSEVLAEARNRLSRPRSKDSSKKEEIFFEICGVKMNQMEKVFHESLLNGFSGLLGEQSFKIEEGYLHKHYSVSHLCIGGVKLQGRKYKVFKPYFLGDSMNHTGEWIDVTTIEEATSVIPYWVKFYKDYIRIFGEDDLF